jgi:hypothetical protein
MNNDRIHPDAEGTGCLILLLSVIVAVWLLALAYHWLTR